jgi:FlaA1/EpsC-like NDP-sugar epimerase
MMRKKILALSRPAKRLLVMFADTVLSLSAVWAAFALRLDLAYRPVPADLWVFLAAPLLAIPIFIRFGLYRAIFRYGGYGALGAVVKAVLVYGFCYAIVVFYMNGRGMGTPRSIGLLQPILMLLLAGGIRAGARFWLSGHFTAIRKGDRTRLLIYGAGDAGAQLAQSLSGHVEFHLLGFIDDDPKKCGNSINGKTIYSPDALPTLVLNQAVTDVLLAIPSASREDRVAILERLRQFPVHVRTLPTLAFLSGGKIDAADIRELEIEDLLGRDSVAPDAQLWTHEITRKVVMVTGAGGSIGSELCRQLLATCPAKLLLVDHNEFGLYTVHAELEQLAQTVSPETQLVPLLGSVRDYWCMHKIVKVWHPAWIYHAAAYKHVPMVEHNPAEGVLNNALATLCMAYIAIECDVPNMVLVSTDKAVRPTNIMGATKRLAEMVLQALAAEKDVEPSAVALGISPAWFDSSGKGSFRGEKGSSMPTRHPNRTRFSMVRFGNVLGSSGSVVPLFRKQIAAGGPITVTDEAVTRYFMTITEAAQLVIQAGVMATGGDVFVLDMGEPVRIVDLARRIIELSGLSIRDAERPSGDIEIKVVGLRPGEKLYEELLIANDPQPTRHPQIFRAREEFMPWEQLKHELDAVRFAAENNDIRALHLILTQLVDGYVPASEVVDWVTQVEEGAVPMES